MIRVVLADKLGRSIHQKGFLKVFDSDAYDLHGRIGFSGIEKDVFDPDPVSDVNHPDGKDFSVVLSHDIDDIDSNIYHLGASLLYFHKYRDPLRLLGYFPEFFFKKNTYDNFSKIIDLEEEFEGRSTFFFLSNSSDPIRKRYALDEVKESIRENIIDRGFEVGLHTGYYRFDDAGKVRKEKEDLEEAVGKKVTGCRNHFLRFRGARSLEVLQRAGLGYDSSFGYHDMIGFRQGIGHPFFPVLEGGGRIMEIPLNIMDGTLFDYLHLDPGKAWEKIELILENARRKHAVVSVLWHNATFTYPIRKPWIKVYRKILEWTRDHNGLLTDCRTIHDHFSRF